MLMQSLVLVPHDLGPSGAVIVKQKLCWLFQNTIYVQIICPNQMQLTKYTAK